MKIFIGIIGAAIAAASLRADPYSSAINQARRAANSEENHQQAIQAAASSNPAPAPAPAQPPPTDPALQATLQNIDSLQSDFANVSSNPTNTQPLVGDLTAAAQGSKPSAQSTSQLANDLANALSGNDKLRAHYQPLARYVHAVFNGSHLAATQQQMILDGTQKIMDDSAVSTDASAKIIGDMKTIATETQ